MTQSYLKSVIVKGQNFQKIYTRKLPTLLYTFEKELNEGDMILIFINPDKEISPGNFDQSENFITPKKASKIFDKITETPMKYPLKKQFLKILKQCFLEVFLQLKDFEGEKKQSHDLRVKYKGMKKQNYEQHQKEKKKMNSDTQSVQTKNYDEEQKKLLASNDVSLHMQNLNEQDIIFQNQKITTQEFQIEHQQETTEQQKEFIPVENPYAPENKKKTKETQKKQKVIKQKKIKKNKKTKIEDDAELAIKKIISGGGFMKYNEEIGIWEKTEAGTFDFLTLLRQTIYILLAYQGIVIREFVTTDGNFMAAVCYAYEKNLKLMGQQKDYQKQCDLAMIDMLSLEPVDQKYRPLRFNQALLKKEKWLAQQTLENPLIDQEESLELRSRILNLLKEIKIHNLPRKCNALNDKSYFLDKEEDDVIQQHCPVPLETWKNYEEYLLNLKTLMLNVDEQYLERKQKLHQYFFQMKFIQEQKQLGQESQRKVDMEFQKSKLSQLKPSEIKDFEQPKNVQQKITYIVYKKFIKHNQSQFRILNNKLKKRLGNAYVRALLKSYKNRETKKKLNLKNIWMHLNVKPLEPYIEFYISNNKRRPRIRDFFNNLYKEFTISEFSQNEFFSSVEKISIMDWQINEAIDMGEVSKNQIKLLNKYRKDTGDLNDILEDVFFPLHNYDQLLGEKNLKFFQELLKIKKIKSDDELQHIIRFQHKIQNKDKDTRNTHLLLPSQLKLLQQFKEKIQAKFSKEEIKLKNKKSLKKQNIHSNKFTKRKPKNTKDYYKKLNKDKMKLKKLIWPIKDIFNFNVNSWFFPWTIQSEVLINYFGEKLALYFKFTIYFLITLIPITLVGLICWGVNFLVFFYDNNSSTTITTDENKWYQFVGTSFNWILGYGVIIWSCYFYFEWDNQEKYFRIINGLNKENILKERMKFKNYTYERSLVDDFINNKQTNKRKIKFKFIFAVFITLICLAVSFGISIGFFYLKNYFVDDVFKTTRDNNLVNFKHNIVNVLETFKIILFDHYFYYIAVFLVEWIDPKYTYEFESMLIFLITFFGIFNNYFMIFFIMLLKDLFMDCAKNEINSSFKGDCLIEAELLFRTYVVFHFIYSMIRIVFSYLKSKKIQQKKRNLQAQNNPNKFKTQESMQILQKYISINHSQLTDQDKSIMIKNFNIVEDEILYNNINAKIEHQIYLEISNRSDDFDTTIIHYYQIFNQFAGIVLFCLLFSLSFLFIYVSVMIELILDRKLYFNLMRRISPYSSSSIGNWKNCLQIVAMLGILTNGYTLTFEYSKWFLDESHAQIRIFLMIVFVLLGLFIWFLGKLIKSQIPLKYKIMQRRQNIIKQTIKNNQRERGNENDTAKVKLNVKAWGQIDYEYFSKLKEQRRKKILDLNQFNFTQQLINRVIKILIKLKRFLSMNFISKIYQRSKNCIQDCFQNDQLQT